MTSPWVIVHKQTQDSQMLSHVVNSITMIENAQCCTFAVCQFQQYRFTHCCMWYWLQYCKRLDNYSFIGGLTNYSRMSWWYKAKDKTRKCAYCIYTMLCVFVYTHTDCIYVYIACLCVTVVSIKYIYWLWLLCLHTFERLRTQFGCTYWPPYTIVRPWLKTWSKHPWPLLPLSLFCLPTIPSHNFMPLLLNCWPCLFPCCSLCVHCYKWSGSGSLCCALSIYSMFNN